MNNVQLSDETHNAGKPVAWDETLEGPIVSISIHRYIDVQTGLPFMRTMWQPTYDQLVELINGGYVVLDICDIYGGQHPVMRIDTTAAQ